MGNTYGRALQGCPIQGEALQGQSIPKEASQGHVTPPEGVFQGSVIYPSYQSIRDEAEVFRRENIDRIHVRHYPTGFPLMDRAFGGGVTSGLHCIGAVPSLGKSSLALQIAYSMSEQGIPCLYYSMEIKRRMVTAKFISRQTYLLNGTSFADSPGNGTSFADSVGNREKRDVLPKTPDELLDKEKRILYTDADWEQLDVAVKNVMQATGHFMVADVTNGVFTADRIEQDVTGYMSRNPGTFPVVFVDYLQIMPVPETAKNHGDKQRTDYNLTRLKEMADRLDIPVILISSFNRESYDTAVTFRSFKDTGNIEYTCNTVMGLQLAGTGVSGFSVEAAKAKYPRAMELVILKQSFGGIGQRIPLSFYTKYSHFEAVSDMAKNVRRKTDSMSY